MTFLQDFAQHFQALSTNALQEFQQIAVRKKYKAQHCLLEVGQVCTQIYVVEQGLLRSYYYDEKGRDTTSWIVAEHEPATQPNSLYLGIPSTEFIETIENSILWVLNAQQLMELVAKHHEMALFTLHITQLYMLRYEERARVLRRMTSAERYIYLNDKYPQIVARAPIGHIASYLGMDVATLSRIRANLAYKRN